MVLCPIRILSNDGNKIRIETITSFLVYRQPIVRYLLIVKSSGRSCSISVTFSFFTLRSWPHVLLVSTILLHMFSNPYCRSTEPNRCRKSGFCLRRISERIFVFCKMLSLLCTQHLCRQQSLLVSFSSSLSGVCSISIFRSSARLITECLTGSQLTVFSFLQGVLFTIDSMFL